MRNSTLHKILCSYDVLLSSQHAQLLAMYRQLRHSIASDARAGEINHDLKQLISEVTLFFRTEEELLGLINFDEIESHIVEHDQILLNLNHYQKQYASSKLSFLKVTDIIDVIQSKVEAQFVELSKILEFISNSEISEQIILPDSIDLQVKESVLNLQHRHIGFILQLIRRKEHKGEVDQDLATLLFEVFDKIKKHFVSEEDIMNRYQYPNYLEHKKIHDELLAEINNYRESYRRGELEPAMFDTLSYAVHEHILDHDKGYEDFFKSLGSTVSIEVV